MAIKYKINLLGALKQAGYSTYRIRKDKIFGERDLQYMRSGKIVSLGVMDTLCRLLDCQPGDIIQYVDDSLN